MKMRELLRESHQFSTSEMRVLAAPVVIDLFLDKESQALAPVATMVSNAAVHRGGERTVHLGHDQPEWTANLATG